MKGSSRRKPVELGSGEEGWGLCQRNRRSQSSPMGANGIELWSTGSETVWEVWTRAGSTGQLALLKYCRTPNGTMPALH